MQLVICAFPGTGKSTISNNAEEYGLIKAHVRYDDREGVCVDLLRSDKVPVFDSDSSIFPKGNFPHNYIEHIKGLLRDFPECVIMVSSHDNVRAALRDAGIDYILVYPQRELKGDYLERYLSRGSPDAFITMMDDKWNDFIDSCEADPSSSKRVLSEGEFLVDKIEELKKFWPAPAVSGDNAFPTAVVSGTESIGDVVCDAEGKPVAAWGHNGLEPLPESAAPALAAEVVVSPEGDVVGTVVKEEVEVEPAPAAGTAEVEVETVVKPVEGATVAEVVAAVVETSPVAGGDVEVDTKPDGTVVVEQSEVVDSNSAADIVADVVEDQPNPTAAIFSAITADAPASDPVAAPAPEVVDLVSLNNSDIPVVAAVDAPEVAAVVVDNGATTAEVVSIEAAPTDVPVSGEVIIAGNESNDDDKSDPKSEGGEPEVTVEVNSETGVVEVETPEGTVTVTDNDVQIEGENIRLVGEDEAVQTDADRAELIELKLEMENDIDAMSPAIEKAKSEEDRGGVEALQDGSDFFKQAAAEAKASYGLDIEPTLAGMEGFLDTLKSAVGKIGATLKKKDATKAVIKRTVEDAVKGAKQYSSAEWQGKQDFINVGKTKISTPAAFKDVSSVGDIETIVNMINKQVDTAMNKHASNAQQRITAGVKLFNKYKGKPAGDKEALEEINAVKITPEYLKGGVDDSGLKNVALATSVVELPVLNKDAVTQAADLLVKVVDRIGKVWDDVIKVNGSLLYEEDIYKSAFWDSVSSNSAGFSQLWDAATYDGTAELTDIGYKNDDVMIAIAQFLERWILNSVK